MGFGGFASKEVPGWSDRFATLHISSIFLFISSIFLLYFLYISFIFRLYFFYISFLFLAGRTGLPPFIFLLYFFYISFKFILYSWLVGQVCHLLYFPSICSSS